MKIQILLGFLYSLTCGIAVAQITTTPAIPLVNGAITITFNSAQESRLGKFTGDLYAHTGVTITGKGNWQNVIGSWGDNSIQPKLTNKGDGIYELTISPDVKTFYSVAENGEVTKLAFVFRSSSGNQQTNDLFVDVFRPELNISFSNPAGKLNIISPSEDLPVTVDASSNDSITLYLNNEWVGSTATSTLHYTFDNLPVGLHQIKAIAYMGTQEKSDSVACLVRGEVQDEPVPINMKDGINYIDDETVTLVLFAPGKSYVYLIGDFNNWLPDNTYQMKKDNDRFWITLSDLTLGKEYIFQYLIDGDLRIADPYSEKISDPWNDEFILSSVYPDLILYPEGKTTEIASVLQTGQEPFQWEVEDFVPPDKNELIIYETLIRDWSNNGDIKTITDSLDYFVRLGINAIELMPFNEFEGNDSWGYNPSFYFAPDKAYGTKNDYKTFIDTCHKKGIAVIMDMVLNHSYGQSPLVRMYFEEDKPAADNPWYNTNSNFQNPDAQWGYDFNHESSHTKALIDSICSFWMREYKIDGFRFDFTKGFSNTPYSSDSWGSDYDSSRIANLKRMSDEIWKRNADAIIIFEHLAENSEEQELADYGILLWGNMNYNYSEAAMGWNEENKSDFSWGSYQQRGWDDPNLITYMESHDEERLMYKNLTWGNQTDGYSIMELSTALERIKLVATFFTPIPGPKMIWQFGELGYDINIDFNGRVGKKPVKWEYYNAPERRSLYVHWALLNYLKTDYDVFKTTNYNIDVAGEVKTIHLNSADNGNITILGNFGVVSQTVNPTFQHTGTWYEYFTETELNVADTAAAIALQPGEYRLYSDIAMDKPTFPVLSSVKHIVPRHSTIFLYPNPVGDEIRINSKDAINSCKIYNISGQVVYMASHIKSNTISIEHLEPGMYFLQLENQVLRFIKN